MEYILSFLALGLLILAAAWWIRSTLLKNQSRGERDQALTMLQNQVNAAARQTTEQMEGLRKTVLELTTQTNQALNKTHRNMGERLDNASRVIHGVSTQLGKLDESAKRIFDVGKNISELEKILQSPKLRGNLGELFLDELLSQILPREHYHTQYTFAGGECVDAVVQLKTGMVAVDAKFPLENFRRVMAVEEDRRAETRKIFIKDVKKHIDAIASKYIRPDEGTFDFALMYIPAENVYYETIIRDDDTSSSSSLFTYAMSKRVIPVSPNSFYAYLQTVMLGLKGLRIEEGARDIINRLARLQKEFERFEEAFRLVGQHLDNSSKKFTEAEKRLEKISGRMEQIEGVAPGLLPGKTGDNSLDE